MLNKKIERVMLISPPGKVLANTFQHSAAPLGLGYLAAVIRNNFEVKIIDGRTKFQTFSFPGSKWDYYGYRLEEIVEMVKDFKPDAVGISCLFSRQANEVIKLAEKIKTLNFNIITIIGGSHPTFLVKHTLESTKAIDCIILGEGEDSFPQLLKSINEGKDYSRLDGLAFRQDDTIIINPKQNYISDLDSLPFPAYDLLPMKFYEQKAVPFSVTFKSRKNSPVVTSRGCTSQCIFCASRNYWGNRYRKRSAENVLDEIEMLVKKYGIKEIQFIDDNLTLDKQRAKAIFQGLIDRKLKIHWNTPNGIAIWTLDEPMLELMRQSGCYELTIAFESGDQDVLKNIIKKPLDLNRAKQLVKKIKQLGIQTMAFFISGFPGETKQQILRSFEFAKEMDLDCAYFFIANPTPGSDLFELCKQKGYIKPDFSGMDVDYNCSHFQTEEFSSEEIEKFILKNFNVYLAKVFLRHPFRFLNKYLKLFLIHPVMSFRTVGKAIFEFFDK
ncbi:MAG: radical SAM protein [Candidatus Omnitrophota bacterium]